VTEKKKKEKTRI